MSSDLSARLDRLADLAAKAQAEQLDRLNELTLSREATNALIAAADPLTIAALVKVAQATKYVRPLDMPVALSEALAALDVQLEKGEQDG